MPVHPRPDFVGRRARYPGGGCTVRPRLFLRAGTRAELPGTTVHDLRALYEA